jgi:hypothetical protein
VEVDKVVVIGPDFKGSGVAFKVMMEGLQSSEDSKEFFVVNFVVLFHWLKGL